MTSAHLQSTAMENVRVVPVEPQVKSAKTRELSLRGARAKAETAKSADPLCYSSPVGAGEQRATGCMTIWRMKMSKRKMHGYVGRSQDGARRVWAQDQDPARAMAEVFDAAREYLKGRPDCGPLELWSFEPATNSDYVAVCTAHDLPGAP